MGSEDATHLVVDEVSVKELPAALQLPSLIVRGEVCWCVTWWRCTLVCHQGGGMSVCYLVLMLPGGDVHWRVISGGGMSVCYLVWMLPGGDVHWCVIRGEVCQCVT